ncbi:hypothetical protein JX265_012198 [Neoarthrinium moseri]|uniref:F-box domain-containing protein n=1 Tax=Neoarthrinium moseri TaxID=1658444 RepID=A0A9Q0AJZ9_9PEZI|nr:hypothetical protein JX266_010582 [Neoarthrinium moseri]KAI1855753.1 hypothetical protein JX265_012198 [Neoarthrinium moseri]
MEGRPSSKRRSNSRNRSSFKEKQRRESWKDDRLNTITPTSGLDLLIRQALARNASPATYLFDEDGNRISPPASPLRRSVQPLESIADRMRQKRRSWYDGAEPGHGEDDDDKEARDPDAPSRLLALPTELQFFVFAHLGLSDLERLRRTCQFYRHILSPEYVRALFGGHQGLASQLTGHCQTCLASPGRASLILQPQTRPLSSKCFQCSVKARELGVGTRVPLASGAGAGAWVCRWCGWPVAGEAHSWANEQFHVQCYDRYYRVLWVFLCLGFAQFAVGVVAAALSLVYFRGELVVFAPTVVNFVLLWVCMAFLMFRGNRIRTYHWVGMVELVIMGLWIPPIYAVARDLQDGGVGSRPFESSVAALAFFATNMLFRLFNCIGNIVLTLGYDMTKHYAPQITLRRRLMNLLMTGLIYWTYPQCVEQRYPPDFN